MGNAAKEVGSFVNTYKADITGFVVGTLVTAGCLVGTAGIGSVGCLVAGGAAGSAVTNVWKQAESGKPFSVGSFLADTALGGLSGLLGPAGSALGKVLPVATSKVTSVIKSTLQGGAKPVPAPRPGVPGAGAVGPKPIPGASNASSGSNIAANRATGIVGEQKAGIIKNTTRIDSSSGTARYRIPDELNSTTIGEVKNVSYQRLTNQLKDFLSYAQDKTLTFNLYVRETTEFSDDLWKLVDAKLINRIDIPGL